MVSINDLEKSVRDKIGRFGFAVISVFADEDFPTFSYTAGLSEKGLPELVMVGIPAKDAHPILNEAAQRQIDQGVFQAGLRVPELIANFDCLVGDVANEWVSRLCWMAQAMASDALAVKARQIIWPDMRGRFPGEEDYDSRFIEIQPDLAIAPEPPEPVLRPGSNRLH